MQTNKCYKLFYMDEIFTIHKGKRLTKDLMIDGNLNFIAAIDDNNGVRQKIDSEALFNGNCITVNYNGSVGNAFYQRDAFWASDDVNVLRLKNYSLNEKIALYLTTVIMANKYRFNYGRKWTIEKMAETKLSLPVDSKGNVDFDFMERYVAEITDYSKIETKIKYFVKPIDIRKWKKFKILNLFDVDRGKETGFVDSDNLGNVPLISSTSNNNGTVKFVSNGEFLFRGNMLTVAINGSIGETFYQEYDFYATSDVAVLNPRFALTKYIALFLVTILDKEKYRYNYGRKFNGKKIENTIIKLPIAKTGEPDWQHMESYIKSLPYSDKI